MTRGKVTNPARNRQIVDATGLRWGTITPTDIDLSWDFNHGEFFVLLELKHDGAPMHRGQREHLEHVLSGMGKATKGALGMIADHDARDPEDEIDAAGSIVREVWWDGKWRKSDKEWTVFECVEWARKQWGLSPTAAPLLERARKDH